MAQISASQPVLERWFALLVRYWAYNMDLVHTRGGSWPGFGYSPDEKAALKSLAGPVRGVEYTVWLALCVTFFILILTAVVIAGMASLMAVTGGEHTMSKTPAALFFLQLGLDLVVSLSLGFPAAMLPAAALTGRWFGIPDSALPDPATTSHYFARLWFQITRVALLGVAALVPVWILVPGDSKFWVIARLVVPLLSPAVAALTAAYYFSARLRRRAV